MHRVPEWRASIFHGPTYDHSSRWRRRGDIVKLRPNPGLTGNRTFVPPRHRLRSAGPATALRSFIPKAAVPDHHFTFAVCLPE